MTVGVWVWGEEPADFYVAGRAIRGVPVGEARLRGHFASTLLSLLESLRNTQDAVWLLRAGTWPVDATRIRLPAPSATGRPLCALGAIREGDPAAPDSQAIAWNELLARTGGDLSLAVAKSIGPIPTPASVYLEAPLARLIAERLAAGESLAKALQSTITMAEARVVNFAPLDVQLDTRLRVLQIVTSLQRGGAERVALDLFSELPQQGVVCKLATLGRPTRDPFTVPPDLIDLSPHRGDRAARAAALDAAARRFGVDVLHGHLLDSEDALLLTELGWPLVMTIHNERNGWPAGIAELPRRGATLLAACSQAVECDLRAVGLETPIRTVWNGIDFDEYKRSPAILNEAAKLRAKLGFGRDDFLLLALANPRPQKRFDRLPAVLAATRAELSQRGIPRQARLVFCGEHEQGNAAALKSVADARTEVERLSLSQHVRWLGSAANVAPVLAACDALVSTSDFEGLSLAHLEALAAGLAVVATDVGGASETALANPAYAVVPRDATPEVFAKAIVDAVIAPPRGGDVAARRHFSRGLMAERYRHFYPRAIAAGARVSRGQGLWLITNNFSTGGAQSSARRLLLELSKRGVPVRAAVLEEQPEFPTSGRQALTVAGVPVFALPTAGSIDAAEAVQELLALIDADPPAAVLCWNALAEYKVLLAEGLLDVPMFDVSPGEMYYASLERYFSRPRPGVPCRTPAEYGRRLSGVIVKYDGEAERAREMLGAPVHVIPNGIEVPNIVPTGRAEVCTAGKTLVIGTSARLSPQKKLEELIAAIQLAHPRLPPYKLLIAGGPERGSEGYAEQLKSTSVGLPIEWRGELANVRPFLAELDLFVMISEPAGCPNASLEALAAGLPVIATDFGGVSEQIESGVSGLVVPRADASALAEAIISLAHDATLRERFGAAGLARVRERFSLERMVEEYSRVCLIAQLPPHRIPINTSRQNHDAFDKSPDASQSTGDNRYQYLEHPRGRVPEVEAMNAIRTQEDAQEAGGDL